MRKFLDYSAILGMVLIQCATIPAIVGAVWFGANLPPLAMVAQSIIALLPLFAHACYNGFKLYAYGNGIGLALQTVTLILILVKG